MKSRYEQTLEELSRALHSRFVEFAKSIGADPAHAPDIALAPARNSEHGDFATSAALAAGKIWKKNPLEVAQAIADSGREALTSVATVEAARPGFLNIRMAPRFWSDVVREIVERGDDYGKSDALEPAGPVLVEFSSANPTGPIVVVQGRAGAIGAALVAMLRFAGSQASAETYVNDAGAQLDTLADSLFTRYAALCGVDVPMPEDGYPGDYLIDIAQRLRKRDGDKWLAAPLDERRRALGRFARDEIVEQQRLDMEHFRVHFDRWFSEATLHESGAVDRAIETLVRSGHAYEHDGAVWLRSTEFGDDKDRVLRRSDGRPTYLAADAAYHADKLERKNKHLINILGPDHHGYIKRLEALVAALGAIGRLEVLVAQHMTLRRGEAIVPMSKRAGNVLTLREVVDEVGVDAARFFFVERAPESHLVFDLELAVEHSAKNPVYYVQYGHARIASILRRAISDGRLELLERARSCTDVALISHTSEIAVIRRLADFGRTVLEAARARAPHRVAEYAREVATDFHAFYRDCVVLGDDDAQSSARLSLCLAAKTVLASALRLLGVSAPDQM